MTADRDARHARLLAQVPEEGCWAVCKWPWLGENDRAFYVRADGFAYHRDGSVTPWTESVARIVSLLDPRPDWQPLPDGPTEAHVGRRVRTVGWRGLEIVGTVTEVDGRKSVVLNNYRWFDPEDGDWYVDANDTDPDTERVEALAKAIRRSTCTDDGTELLDLLRAQGWDLVKREDGESR